MCHTRCSRLFLAIGAAALVGCGGDPSAPTLAVATVELSPVSDTLTILGQTVQFTAVAKDAAGNVLTGKTFIWSSADLDVATVDATGLATSIGDGSATITATTGGRFSTASIAVILPVASVTVSPDSPTILRGVTLQLTAMLNSQEGDTLAGRKVTWSSTAPTIAVVDSEGLVTSIAPGSSAIVASAEGHSDTTTVTVTLLDFASIDPGWVHTCGLTTSGVAYCWGNYGGGLLGVGAVTENCPGAFLDGSVPCTTKPMVVSGSVTFATLNVANFFRCGLTATGNAYCWGTNEDGQLGNGSTRQATTPTFVSGGLSFASISGGGNFACGVTTGGEAYCWGSNNQGQLGTTAVSDTCEDPFEGTVPCSRVPVAVTGGLTFTQISAGFRFACGITAGGEVYCWGDSGGGRLGNGSSDGGPHPTPELVAGGLGFASVSTGSALACGLTTGGEAYCWGENTDGSLGNGLFTGNQLTPGPVLGGHTFASISTGDDAVCGVTTSSEAYCWGANWGGMLGIGSGADRSTPTAVLGGLSFASVSVNSIHTCGRTTTDEFYCWGFNLFGELGDGTVNSRTEPTKVIGSR